MNNIKKLAAAITVSLLAVSGAVLATSPAYGEDTAPEVEITVEESQAAPGGGDGFVPVDICHSGNGVNFTWITVDNAGALNGHSNHGADIYDTTEAECLALNPVDEEEEVVEDIDYVTVAWHAPGGPGSLFDPDQTLLTFVETDEPDLSALDGYLAGLAYPYCYIQIDVYYDSEITAALIAGGVLHNAQDPDEDLISGGLGTAWKFYTVQDCTPPPPPPVECVATSGWFTEDDDVAPVQIETGLEFVGAGPGVAVGTGVALTGNLQGLNPLTYTTSPDSAKFYWRYVIDPNAGDINGDAVDDWKDHYVSLTVSSGSPINGSSSAYSNRLGTSKTLDEFAALWPANTLRFGFFHMDTAAVASDRAVLTGVVSDCITASFIPTKPGDEVTVTNGDPVFDCDTATATYSITTVTTTYSWNEESHSYTATVGEPVITQGERGMTEGEIAENCEITEQPETPTFKEECGPDNWDATLPEDGEHFTYGMTIDGDKLIVNAIANEGWHFAKDAKTEWVFDITDEACPSVLAYTGSELPIAGGVAGLLLLLGGIAAAIIARRSKTSSVPTE